jgi:heme A synthase
MALQQADLSDILTLILLVIAIILVAIILYIGTRIITGKKETETGYILRLLAVSVIIVLLVAVVIGAVVGAVGQLDPTDIISGAANQIIPVLVYLAIVYLIKYILIPEQGEVTKFNASIWIGVITLFLIYVFNILTTQLFNTPIIVGV